MDTWTVFFFGMITYMVLGAAACAIFDDKDQIFFKWVQKDPTGMAGSLVAILWPFLVACMIYYRIKFKNIKKIPSEKRNE